ncbi:Uncharacterised protein [Bordetella pertussis]|nr:Uncharacterised protein [Bordetella pertussis]
MRRCDNGASPAVRAAARRHHAGTSSGFRYVRQPHWLSSHGLLGMGRPAQ